MSRQDSTEAHWNSPPTTVIASARVARLRLRSRPPGPAQLALAVCPLLLAAGCGSLAHSHRYESVATTPGVDDPAPDGGDSGADEEGWQFEVTPFLWVVGVTGSEGADGNDVNLDPDPTVSLNAVVPLMADGRSGAWGFTADILYASLDLQGESPGMGTPATSQLDLGLIEAAGTWRPGSAPVDVLLGLRYYDIGTEVAVGQAWEISPAWRLLLRGDVGGFGVGTNFSWQAFGNVDWRFVDWCALGLGYRAIGIDLDEGGASLDAVIHGPMLSVGFTF